jgi:enolase
VDERLLYSKIVNLVKKPSLIKIDTKYENNLNKVLKCTDLAYLIKRTKANPELMMEMIALYLEQTPPLVAAMKDGLKKADWKTLAAAVHKMIPSFTIVGIHNDFENKAKKIQEYAIASQQTGDIVELVLQIENICEQACLELKEEFETIKNNKK